MAMQVSNNPSAPWILANAAGFVMGGAIAAVVVLAGEEPLVGTVRSQASAAAALAPVTAVSLGLFGVLVGLAQWLVLQRWWSITGWWIAATAGGWAAAGAIAGTLSGFLSGTVTGVGPGIGVGGYVLGTLGAMAAIAVVPGVLQSLVIRHRVGGLGWPAAHLAGQGAGFLVAFPVMLLVASVLGLNLPSPEAWVVAGFLWGTVFGIVTWKVALARAVARQPGPRAASTRAGSAAG
jgi:hypothetical protein